MLNIRISGSIDYYNRQIHNLLFLYDVPSPPNLYNQTLANVGTMQNKGVEVMLNTNENALGSATIKWYNRFQSQYSLAFCNLDFQHLS